MRQQRSRCRRGPGGRGRGQEGGLEVIVREEETWREEGYEGRIKGEEKTHSVRQLEPCVCVHTCQVYREKLDYTVRRRRLTNGDWRTTN